MGIPIPRLDSQIFGYILGFTTCVFWEYKEKRAAKSLRWIAIPLALQRILLKRLHPQELTSQLNCRAHQNKKQRTLFECSMRRVKPTDARLVTNASVRLAPRVVAMQEERLAEERLRVSEQEEQRSRSHSIAEVPENLKNSRQAVPILETLDELLKLKKAKKKFARRSRR